MTFALVTKTPRPNTRCRSEDLGTEEGEEKGQRATRGYRGGNQVRFPCSRGESRRKERGGPHQEGIASGPAMRAMPSHRVLLDGCMSDCAGGMKAFLRVGWSWGV